MAGDNVPKKIVEGINDQIPSLRIDISDDQLIKDINQFIGESANLQEEMNRIGAENENYWEAKQLEQERIKRGKSKVVDNRLWLSLETIIPIATSRTPEPTIRLKQSELREETKQILMNAWEVPTDDDAEMDMQAMMELCVRQWALSRIGILKYWYDPEIDDIRTAVIRADKVRFDKKGKTIDKCRFIAEYCDDTVEGLIAKWPDKEKEILQAVGKETGDGSSITYLEVWSNEFCVYKYQNVILEKKKNPNFDYGDMSGTGQPMFNLFKKPRKPYLKLGVFTLGKNVYDNTSFFEQARTLQDVVNKTKRNIADNAADNGTLVGSGDYIDKKVLEAYTGAPDEKLWVKQGSARDALQRLEPKQMAPYVFNDLADNKSEIDNIFGTHDTTRGEHGADKTATESTNLRQGDMGRIDIVSRALDRIAQDWYAAYLHMKLVFTTKPQEINSNDEEGTSIIFDRTKYIDPQTQQIFKIIIKVKPGSSMSIDKDARRKEAMELMKGNMIDPITFFSRMDYANPQEMAQKLFIWKTNPIALFPQLLAAQRQQQAMQAQQQTQQAANTPIPEGTPIQLPNGQTINQPPNQ